MSSHSKQLKRQKTRAMSSDDPPEGDPKSPEKRSSEESTSVTVTEPLAKRRNTEGEPKVSEETETQNITKSKAYIGQAAPDFTADAFVDGALGTVSLSSDDIKEKYRVLIFCPINVALEYPLEILPFLERMDEFKNLNVAVWVVSTDPKFSPEQGGLGEMKIPILADTNYNISRKYGVLNEENGTAFRGLFVIDREGDLRQMTISNIEVAPSADEILRLVRALKKSDGNNDPL